jgi:hypothetical protein
VGSYDSPGFTDRTPAGVVVQHTGAGGTQPSGVPDTSAEPGTGTVGFSALVVPVSGSVINGDRVQVGAADTNVGRQQDLYSGSDGDLIAGIPGDYLGFTGAGQGHVMGPSHPNNGVGT